jgi:hypothetical protein
VEVDGRKTRSVGLYHLSWWKIVTEAVVQHRHRGVADPDQAWILGELIAYLDHEKSGAGGFRDMGEQWVGVRNAARDGTLRGTDPGARKTAERWEQFIEYLCMGLSQDLGTEVSQAGRRRQSSDAKVKDLAETGRLSAAVNVPDAVGPITVEADLRAQLVTTSVQVDAPKEGRPLTRVNWMLRQLREAPDDLRVDVAFASTRETASALLGEAREYPQRLLSPSDQKREPRAFTLALSRKMGTKRGKAQGSFVIETRRQAVDFYRQLVQNLRRWQPSPPKLPDEPAEKAPETPQPKPPAFSAEDREVGEGVDPARASAQEEPHPGRRGGGVPPSLA